MNTQTPVGSRTVLRFALVAALSLSSGCALKPSHQTATSSGPEPWLNVVKSASRDAARAIGQDATGAIYVTGHFSTHLDENELPFLLPSVGGFDVFVSRIDASGERDWIMAMGGAEHDYAQDIAVAADGTHCVTGTFKNTLTHHRFSGPVAVSRGETDAFLQCSDRFGQPLWSTGIGGKESDNGMVVSIESDASGVTIGGNFSQTIGIGESAHRAILTSNGARDVFLANYGMDGQLNWSTAIGGTGFETIRDIGRDESGNYYAAIRFEGALDIPLARGATKLAANGQSDVALIKLDPAGNPLWARSMGGQRSDDVIGLAVSGSRVAITGTFSQSVLVTNAPGALEIASNGSSDIYLASWDLDGGHPQLKGFGGPNSDIATGIVTDGNDLLLAGTFIERTTIDGIEFTDHATGAYVVRIADDSLTRELTVTGQKYEDIADMVVLPGRMLAVTGSFYGSLFAGPLTEPKGPKKKSDTYTLRVALSGRPPVIGPSPAIAQMSR